MLRCQISLVNGAVIGVAISAFPCGSFGIDGDIGEPRQRKL
jgi:hypothetical protein